MNFAFSDANQVLIKKKKKKKKVSLVTLIKISP